MPGSRLEIFPGAGHMPHDDDPERFAALLRDFCAEHRAGAADRRPLAAAAGRGAVSGERLSALDASFLAVERPGTPMHVGWVATLRPARGRRAPGFAELRATSPAGWRGAPRFRQRLAGVPLGLHDPVWVDDPGFDPASHLLARRGADLDALVDAILSTPLAPRPAAVGDLDRRRAGRRPSR